MQEDEPQHETMADEAAYLCDSCGEEIIIPVDASAGSDQEYVEDCPVCCNANVIRVQLRPGQGPWVESRPE